MLSARSKQALVDSEAEILAQGNAAVAMPGSVGDREDVRRIVAAIGERFGRLDVLVNNAGVSAFAPAEQLSDDEWREVIAVNLDSAFRCCREAFPLLERSEVASIVNVSSIHGRVAGPRAAAYAASKGGLELLTRTLAVEWADRGIRVNSVAPGYVETEMTASVLKHPKWGEELRAQIPLGRFATLADVVPAALFLASPLSGYVTGATLVVDGGWTAR